MQVKITQDHIDKGQPYNSESCAVALGLTDALGKPVMVGVDGIFEVDSEKRIAYRGQLPGVDEFIRKFDAGEPVEPIEFELPLN